MLQTPVNITLDGKGFKMYPLTDEDNDTLHEYVRGLYLDNVMKSTDNEQIVGIACDRIQNMIWTRPPGNIFMTRRAGVAKLFEVSCRNELAYEATIKATTEEISAAFVNFRRVNEITKEDAEAKEGTNENP